MRCSGQRKHMRSQRLPPYSARIAFAAIVKQKHCQKRFYRIGNDSAPRLGSDSADCLSTARSNVSTSASRPATCVAKQQALNEWVQLSGVERGGATHVSQTLRLLLFKRTRHSGVDRSLLRTNPTGQQ